jgi:hypothetical protein
MSEPGKDDGVIVKQESVEDGVLGVEATKIGLLDRVGLSIVRYFASPIRLEK